MDSSQDAGTMVPGGGSEHTLSLSADRPGYSLTIAAISALVSAILIGSGGNVAAAAAVSLVLGIIVLSFFRVDLAFFVFFGMVLLFDQFIVVPFGEPPTASVRYFDNLKQIPFLPPTSAGVMNPLEIQLALMLSGWFLALTMTRSARLRAVPVTVLALTFLFALVGSLAHGMGSGGELLPALWEVRALCYFLLLYFFVPQIIRTRAQVNALLWIMIAAVTVKDLQGVARFAMLGFHFNGNPCLTNHEDPVFTTDLLILLFCLLTFRVRTPLRGALLGLLIPLLLGFYTGQRRAAYAGFMVSILVFLILLRPWERRSVLRFVAPVLILVAGYSAAFWNSSGRLALPVQLIKSGLFSEREVEGEHYYSNLYREVERYDLAMTVRNSPLVGTGFGKVYEQPLPLVPIPYPLRDWIPHNEILWLMVKMGAAGFLAFSLFFCGLLYEAASFSRALKDPFLRSVCIMAAAAVVNQMVVSYFDLQLTFYRNMVLLGTVCGLLPVLKAIDDLPGDDRRARGAIFAHTVFGT